MCSAKRAALPGAPPIAGLAGDQQASLVGQGCVRPGLAKATFGTGAMLDLCVGDERPAFPRRGPGGTFPIVAWSQDGKLTWGIEAIMMSAGSCVEWLRDDLGILSSVAESDALAASCTDSGGVWFVPALLGLGTPLWDYGARGTLLGLTRGSGRAEVVRAVLEGIAHRGADLLEAAETDSGLSIGGLARRRGHERRTGPSPRRSRTPSAARSRSPLSRGDDARCRLPGRSRESEPGRASRRRPPSSSQGPSSSRRGASDRPRWLEARGRALRTVPELSDLDF